MYRLANTEDLSFFAGIELLQVCVGTNDVILRFDRDVTLTILSDYAVGPDGATTRYERAADGALCLLPLLSSSVVGAIATDDGDLKVAFASGAVLVAFDTSERYESFSVASGTRLIVV